MCKDDRDGLEEMGHVDKCDTEKFGTLDSSEKTVVILGDRWWPQTAEKEGGKLSKTLNLWGKT